jgi:hypothetical protein
MTLSACALLAGLSAAPPAHAAISTIGSNFNGTPIPSPRYVWFNSHLTSVIGPVGPMTIFARNQKITFSDGTTNYNLTVPDAQVHIDPLRRALGSSTSFQSGQWVTRLTDSASDPFLSGLSFKVPDPAGLPGGINPVNWTANFFADQPGVDLQWQWSAAAYTDFSTDYNSLAVTPIDGANGFSQSGTPGAFADFVVGGARGGGGSNYTGSNSATGTVVDATLVPEPATWAIMAAAMWFLTKRPARWTRTA